LVPFVGSGQQLAILSIHNPQALIGRGQKADGRGQTTIQIYMHDIAFIVIPGLTRNPVFFNSLYFWMPDPVRHDNQKNNIFLIFYSV